MPFFRSLGLWRGVCLPRVDCRHNAADLSSVSSAPLFAPMQTPTESQPRWGLTPSISRAGQQKGKTLVRPLESLLRKGGRYCEENPIRETS